ncbi:MAG: serine/threonine protein kinase [Anaerolineales bacterium]|nr:serine/threonine protein kinase [Anaerolineales bacterium]
MFTLRPADPLGPYRVERVLRQGGMAVLALARDRDALPLALKVARLRGDATDEAVQTAVRREAEILQRLSHKRVVRILPLEGAGADRYLARAVAVPGAPWFFALEYLAGGTLTDHLQAAGPLSLNEAVHVAGNVALGLYHAHDRGQAHNDLKADNIMFRRPVAPGEAPEPVLIDFGIAAPLNRQQDQAGSTFIMSPERVLAMRGQHAPERAADAGRSDVWSMGVLLYQMLTGRLPFPALAEHSLTSQILNSTPAPIPALNPRVSAEVDGFVRERCLAKQPTARASLLELLRFLETVRGQQRASLDALRVWGQAA